MASDLSHKMNQYRDTTLLHNTTNGMDSDPILEQTFENFFSAYNAPVNNHEEWLLRMCSQLMHREASVVSFMEQKAKQSGTARGYRKKRDSRCHQHPPPQSSSYRASEASTNLSEETGVPPSNES